MHNSTGALLGGVTVKLHTFSCCFLLSPGNTQPLRPMLTCLAWCGPPPVAGYRRDSFRKGRAAQSGVARKTRLIWAKVGIWDGCGEALIKRGHEVGLGYFLVLIPSKECGAIGCAINLGRTLNSSCRFAHGAGRTRFLRVRSTGRVRANIFNFPARIFGSV